MFDRSRVTLLFLRAGFFLAAVCLMPHGGWAQEDPPVDAVATDFPGGVTPTDVFNRLDLLSRQVDRLIETKNIGVLRPLETNEVSLGPMHVYQIMIACATRSQELNDQTDVLAVPTLSAKPRDYHPRDVRFVVDLMIGGIERVAQKLAITDLPSDDGEFLTKTPTDVFHRASLLYLKLNALCGYDEIEPGVVFAEMVRVTEDVRSILRQADSESRYRIDAPQSVAGLTPTDVYKKCLTIRRVINKHRIALGEKAVRIPGDPADDSIEPRAVFIQTQILLAELNHLKMHTKTTSSTPLAVPVNETKLPSDVHQQASLVEHLLLQIDSGADVGLAGQQTKVEP